MYSGYKIVASVLRGNGLHDLAKGCFFLRRGALGNAAKGRLGKIRFRLLGRFRIEHEGMNVAASVREGGKNKTVFRHGNNPVPYP